MISGRPGPLQTFAHPHLCRNAARHSGHSLRVQISGLVELTVCGLSGLMHVQLLLMQHFLAVAADFMLRCGFRRGSGRSKLQSRRISDRPFAASCSSSHIADFPDIRFSHFADVAFTRACGMLIAAMQHVSPKQPFNANDPVGFQFGVTRRLSGTCLLSEGESRGRSPSHTVARALVLAPFDV